jgi:hypothetical protein
MALSKKVVVFDLNTTTGNQAVSGVGFEPKLVILFCNGTSSGVVAGNAFSSLGAATSSTARWAVGQWHTDNAANSETARSARTDKILDVPIASGASSEYQADLVSMDSDGFTINIGTTPGVALRCIALCLGGTDIDVAVGSFSTGTTTGSAITAVSGLAFQPKAALTAHSTTSASVSATTRYNIGFASGASNEWGATSYESDNSAQMATAHGWSASDYIYGGVTSGLDTDIDFNAFTSDGWTHNITAVPASMLICYIALGGNAQYYVGNDAQKTTTGTEATTGVGFEPSALIANMALRTTAGYDANGDFYTHLGFMDGTAEAGGHVFSEDDVGDAHTSRGVDSTYSLFAVTDDATPTVAAKASLSSFDSDGFTVNWNTADATARLFGFLAIGAAAGGSLDVSATTDALTLAEYAATIGKSINVSANVDALTLAEYAATVSLARDVSATVDALTLAEYQATIGLSLNISAGTDALTLAEYPASVGSVTNIAATTDALTLAEYAATIGLSLNVQATTDALTLAEYPASLGSATNVEATTDALRLAEYPATVSFALDIPATTDALTLTEYRATIGDGAITPAVTPAGGGRSKKRRRVMVNGRLYNVTNDELQALLAKLKDDAATQAAMAEALGDEALASEIKRKVVRLAKRVEKVDERAEKLRRLRDEDEQILGLFIDLLAA